MRFNLRDTVYAWSPGFLRPTLDRTLASPVGYRLARGTFWTVAGAVISRGLMLVAGIIVARILGMTAYGEYGMIRSTVALFAVFAGFGLGLTATKHVAELRSQDPDRAGRIIAMAWIVSAFTGALMALFLFFFAPWLAAETINAPHLSGVLRIASLILLINALNGAQTGALSGLEAFKTIAFVNLIVGLISFPVLIAGAHVAGLTGAVWALVINLLFNWLLNHVALRREASRYRVPVSLRHWRKELPLLWRFSAPAVLAGVMVGPVNWICNAILVNNPNGYDEMAVFNAANQWHAVLIFLPGMLGSVLLPVLSERLGQDEKRQSARLLVLAIKANILLVLPMVLLVSVASPYIMGLYGAGFVSGWPTLIVVLVTTTLLCIQQPVGQIIAASGRMWTAFAMNTGWALVFIASTLLLVPLGSFGLASARAIAYAVHATWTLGFAFLLFRKEGLSSRPLKSSHWASDASL